MSTHTFSLSLTHSQHILRWRAVCTYLADIARCHISSWGSVRLPYPRLPSAGNTELNWHIHFHNLQLRYPLQYQIFYKLYLIWSTNQGQRAASIFLNKLKPRVLLTQFIARLGLRLRSLRVNSMIRMAFRFLDSKFYKKLELQQIRGTNLPLFPGLLKIG